MSSRRNLLICFDAFGTLFAPKRPVAEQYAEVARSVGLRGFSDEDVQLAFRAAFKDEAKRHPNYGKASGLDAEKWWRNIIHNTFQPLVGTGQRLPSELAPNLLHRFSSHEGYKLLPGVRPLLRKLRDCYRNTKDGSSVVVGVVTNSDDRVPGILTSLGLRVSPLRYGVPFTSSKVAEDDLSPEYDIDFTVISYDVGHEKPDRRIFEAAEEMLDVVVKDNKATGDASAHASLGSWQKLYVGDDYEKDVVGALNAGWSAVLVAEIGAAQQTDLERVETRSARGMEDQPTMPKAFGCSDLEKLAEWLTRPAA